MASPNWIIDVRWLSDRTVNAARRIDCELEHVNAVFTAYGRAKISLFYADSAFIKPLAPMIFMTHFRL